MVIAWDAPGAGLSSDPSESFSMSDWGRCLAEFLDRLDIAQAHVVGLSWGGVLAQEFYRLHPSRVLRLILADTYAGWKGSFPASVCDQRLARCEADSRLTPDEFVSRWVPEMFTEGAPDSLREEMAAIMTDFHPRGFRLMARSLAETDTADLLVRIESPTLLLWGDEDRRSPMNIAERLRDAIPNAELAVIAKAGHVSNMEQPDVFNAHVRRFCL
jgi:pimeloyl-ACP methyl ester carboxylesterase